MISFLALFALIFVGLVLFLRLLLNPAVANAIYALLVLSILLLVSFLLTLITWLSFAG